VKVIKMSDDLFVQRRRVMQTLYEAHKVLNMDLPRIKVRIVDFEKETLVLGKCFINKNYITISRELKNWDEDLLRHVVWHELAHAYFNAKHDDKCPLMNPVTRSGKSRAILAKALRRCAGNRA